MSSARAGGARGRARGSASTTPRGASNSRGRGAPGSPFKPNAATTPSPFAPNGTRSLRGGANMGVSATAGGTSARSQTMESWQARYTALTKARERERSDAIRRGIIADPDKPRSLSDAVTPMGTCQDMCAEYERVQRVVQRDVWPEERVAQHSPYSSGEREPDEARFVKKFRRAAAGLEEQLPSDLRPPPILKKTCDYLFNEIIRDAESLASVHHFVWDRTRAVRNDFSIQQLTKAEDLRVAVDCYERIARFHIVSLHLLAGGPQPYLAYDSQQEREQLDRTLLSLLQYYDDCRGRIEAPNEPEFRAYSIIFQMQDPFPDMEDRVQKWPLHILRNPRVQLALDLFAAASNGADAQGPLKPRAPQLVAQQDWERFWVLIASKRVSYLMACVAEIYFNLIRRTVLNALWRAFRGNPRVADQYWTPSILADMFAYDDESDAQQFCTSYGFSFRDRQDGDGQYLDLTSVRERELPPPDKTLPARMKSSLVEHKRLGRTIPAIINGMNVRQAQDANMMIPEEAQEDMEFTPYTTQDGEGQVEQETETSLFIPQTTSSTFGATQGYTTQPRTASNPFATNTTFSQPSDKPAASGFTFGKPSGEGSTYEKKLPSSTFTQAKLDATSTSPFGGASSSPFAGFTKSEQTTPKVEFGKPAAPKFSWSKPPETASASNSVFATAPASTQTSTPSLFAPAFSQSTSSTNDAVVAPSAPKAPAFNPGTFTFGNGNNTTSSASIQNGTTATAPAFPPFSSTKFSFAKPETEKEPPPSTTANTSPSHDLFDTAKAGFTTTPKVGLFAATPNPSQQPTKDKPNAVTTGQKSPTASLFDPQSTADADAAQSKDKPAAIPPVPGSNTAPMGLSASQPGRKASFSQDTKPKKPSPLSHSFSAEDGLTGALTGSDSQALVVSAADVLKDMRAQRPEIEASEVFNNMKHLQENEAQKALIREQERRTSLIDRITHEITFADRWGFMDQYVEFHVGKVITSVQNELYHERITAEADKFRRSVLSHRYGLRWREIYRRKKHVRQGRLRRERARQSLLESKMGPEDRHRSSRRRSTAGSPALQQHDPVKHKETIDRMFQQTVRSSRASSVASSVQQALCPPVRDNDRPATSASSVRRQDHVDDRGRISKPSTSRLPANSLGRSAFLSFALPFDAPNRASTTQTNYFRLKAMGISTDSSVSRGAKRQRTSSIGSVTGTTPPSAKRLTLESSSPARSVPVEPQEANSKSKVTNEQDEALFARLRAAREGLNEATQFLRSEMAKRSSGSPPGVTSPASPFHESPSMARARSETRRSASQLGAVDSTLLSTRDVPAYRLRESRFVPREQYGRAIERAQEIRAARSLHGSVTSDRSDDNKLSSVTSPTTRHATSLANGVLSPNTPLPTGNEHQSTLPHEALNENKGRTPNFSASLQPWNPNEVPVVSHSMDFSSLQHIAAPQDFTVPPDEVNTSLAASFGPKSTDQAPAWSLSSNSNNVPVTQRYGGEAFGNAFTGQPLRDSAPDEESDGGEVEDDEDEGADDGLAHANPFAALAHHGDEDDGSEEASDELEDEDGEDEEVDAASDVDEEEDGFDDADDEFGEEYDEDEEDEGEYDEEQYMDPRIAAAGGWQPHVAQSSNEALTPVGGTEDDAIELSD